MKDCETWYRKHKAMHEIQEALHLSDISASNLLALPEKTLEEIKEKLEGYY
ncbi:MAG: hypothetical protein ACOC5T_02605 [Elusimicrobiota bacterium]